MIYMRKYGTATTINFALWATDGTALKTDAAYASGDVKIMKDEGAEGNTSSGFTDEGQGYSQPLTATEMEAARVTLYVVDQGTKAWLDKPIHIETYGHPSAAHPNIGIDIPQGTLSGTHTTTTADLGTNAPADIPVGSLLVNLTTSEAVFVTSYATGTGVATFAALGSAWTDGDHWYLIYGAASGLATAANLAALETKVDTIDTVVDANKVILDKLPNGGALDDIESDLTAVKTAVQTTIPGTITTIDTVVDAVKAKTDSLTFTVSNQVDANIQSINDTTITGNGGSGTEFGV